MDMNKFEAMVKAMEFITAQWGEKVADDIYCAAIDQNQYQEMSLRDFLSNCTACGGNWGGMLLTGIKKVYPLVWNIIPDDMGMNVFTCLCAVLEVCGVILPQGE